MTLFCDKYYKYPSWLQNVASKVSNGLLAYLFSLSPRFWNLTLELASYVTNPWSLAPLKGYVYYLLPLENIILGI